jgi:triosephosphate isomerase
MRDVIVAANWKMHTTPADAGELARVIDGRTRVAGVRRVICAPYTSLAAVGAALADVDSDAAVGAQNVHHELAGAYTGEISAPMLEGLATWVILGHSERRRDAAETDALIGRKLARAVEAGLRPIVCVGEQLDEREAGRAQDVVATQLRGALAEHDATALTTAGLVIAYEPVWAIGTGRNATGADAAAMADAIRAALDDLGWLDGAAGVPILYGGSVTSVNIGEFLAEPAIDGALVGGASLKPDEMAGIVARAGITAQARGLAA